LIDLLGLLMTNQWSVLIFIDMLTGKFAVTGWGWPMWESTIGGVTYNWMGSWVIMYISEWLCWFVFPIVSMFWWRSWANKHPELVEEL
jgi:hypothetical protein